jgi:hypothetical protein
VLSTLFQQKPEAMAVSICNKETHTGMETLVYMLEIQKQKQKQKLKVASLVVLGAAVTVVVDAEAL